jgi:putative hydrolase of the HAD superfamily
MNWLLCDYGEVLSLAQPADDRVRLEEAARSGPGFWAGYWKHRPDYDRGSTAVADYWSAVLGRRPNRRELERLVERDVAAWLHPNPETLAAVGRAAQRGFRLAILSNAPHEVANAIDGASWFADFVPRLFSCRVGMIKPEAGIYAAALTALDAIAEEVFFLDDRPENVSAARRIGMQAHLFSTPADVDAVVGL